MVASVWLCVLHGDGWGRPKDRFGVFDGDGFEF